MEKNARAHLTENTEKNQEKNKAFILPRCRFAATCGDCYWNDGGWCKKHSGWVDLNKWACSSFS